MFRGLLFPRFLALVAVSGLSVGCLSNKKEAEVTEAEAPPPAAYPSSPDGYAETSPSGPVPPPSNYGPEPATVRPAEFKLRDGETLVTYTIEPGDTLGKIATTYNTSYSRIMAANGMTSDRIYAGKTLQIPTSAPPGFAMNSDAPTPPAAASSSGGRYYGAGSVGTSPSTGSYSTTPSTAPSYSGTTQTAPSPASTSYPPVAAPPIPPQTQQPAGSFPQPNFGSGTGVQFSE